MISVLQYPLASWPLCLTVHPAPSNSFCLYDLSWHNNDICITVSSRQLTSLPNCTPRAIQQVLSDLYDQSWHNNDFCITVSSRQLTSLPNCTPRAIQQFPSDLFDQNQRRHGAIIIHIMAAVYMFAGFAYLCDDYFVPSLEVICDGKFLTDTFSTLMVYMFAGFAYLRDDYFVPSLELIYDGKFLTSVFHTIYSEWNCSTLNTFCWS